MRRVRALVVAAIAMSAGCGGAPPPPFRPVADVKLLMEAVVDPSADVVWEAVATTVTTAGREERRPRSDEDWEHVRNGAVALTEAGNLLMMVPRAYDADDWMTHARALIDAGDETLRIVTQRDVSALLAVGERIDEACEQCHKEYSYENAPRRRR